MKTLKRFYCRSYQFVMKMAIPFLPYRKPKLLDSIKQIPEVLRAKKINKILLVTSKNIRSLGLTGELEFVLKNSGIEFAIFDKLVPNPTIKNVENGLDVYLMNGCEGIIAFGGGSVMDCAKMIGARAVNPTKTVPKMKGLMKVKKKLPLFFAIPTTAGTGSETTIAAVITDEKSHHKYAINDFNLIPHFAILDYKTTLKLPKFITATTGMDALTHAVEAYIGRTTTRETRKFAKHSVKLIVENLRLAYDDGDNETARQNMLLASFEAGIAFTKSYVGYVHAVAHSLGGKYGVAHGLANAVILPYFLKEYGKTIEKKLSKLAKISGIAENNDDNKTAAEKFRTWIEKANEHFGLPKTFDEIQKEDIDELVAHAESEANPLYPVPKLMDKNELSKMYHKIGGIEK